MAIGFVETKQKLNQNEILPANFTHSIIFGETGSGKTTGIINPTLLNRMQKGHGILIFDYKGHYHTHIKHLAIQANRLEDIITIGEPWGAKYNLLKNIPLNFVSKFLKIFIGMPKAEDKFWEQSAVNLGYGLIKALYFYSKIDNDITYSLKEVLKYIADIEKLEKFKEDIIETIKKNHYKSKQYRYFCYELKRAYDLIDSIASKSEIRTLKRNQKCVLTSVVPSLVNPLSNIAHMDFLNEDEIDVFDELDKGKIIIVNSSNFNDNELSGIMYAMFSNVLKRNIHHNKEISIFIDEAQKVLNETFDLPIDILRETKVDVILATQSIANLESKIGKIKTEELLANLTTKIYLNGAEEIVKEKHYLKDNKEYPLNPIYISKEEAFEAEYQYQQLIKDKLPESPTDTKGIFIHHPTLSKHELLYKTIDDEFIKVEYIPTNDDLMDKILKDFEIDNPDDLLDDESIIF